MKKAKRLIISNLCTLALLGNGLCVLAQDKPKEQSAAPPAAIGIIVESGGSGANVLRWQTQGKGEIFTMPAEPGIFIGGGQGGEYTFSYVSSEMSFNNKLVKGAPYAAEGVTEFVQILPDGNRITRKSSAPLYRDSQGRVRREQSFDAVGPFAAEQHTQRTIFISDPAAGVNYILDPQTIIARKMTMPPPASEESANPPLQKKRTEAALQANAIKKVPPAYPPVAKAAGAQGAVQVRITVSETGDVVNAEIISGHPLLREAALEAARQWKFSPTEINGKPVKVSGALTFNFTLSNNNGATPARAPQPPQPPNSKTEPLGTQMIEGVQAEGKRTIITIPAGQIGNERPIEIVHESWYSPELQITLMTRQYDPRQGETIYRLVNLNRAEPDAALFQVPSDYTIKEEPFGFRSFNNGVERMDLKVRRPQQEQ